MPFSVGDKVVHPSLGAGEVVALEDREFVQGFVQYYVISMTGSGSILYVPVSKVDELGIRPIMSQGKLGHVLETLRSDPHPLPESRQELQQQAEDKIRTGSPIPIAEAVRDLSWRKRHASLSKRESDLLAKGRELLTREVALVSDAEVTEAKEAIEDALNTSLERDQDESV